MGSYAMKRGISSMGSMIAVDSPPQTANCIVTNSTHVLRVSKWRDTFERAESRKLKTLTWVSLPTSFTSSGYQAMLDEFGDEASSIYGAWCALVVIAAGCNVRGVLADSRGNPLKPSWFARMTGFPVEVFSKLIVWASSPNIRWLDSVPASDVSRVLASEQQNDRDSPDAPPSSQGNTPTTRPNQTRPNLTKPDITQPHQTVATGRPAPNGQIDWRERWRSTDRGMGDEEFVLSVREIAKKFLKLKNPLDRETIWQVAWVSAAFDFSVADACVDKLRQQGVVQNASKYVDGAMRRMCEERGERWATVRELVPASPGPPSPA